MIKSNQRKLGMLLSYANSLLLVFVNIFITSFLISRLGESEYGVYQMMASFAGYLTIINFGTSTVMTRFVSMALSKGDKKAEQNFIATCLIISLVFVGIILAAAAVLFMFLDNIYSASLTPAQIEKAKVLFLFIVGNIVVTLVAQAFQGIINAYEHFVVNNLWQILRTALKAGLVFALVSIKADSIIIVLVDLVLAIAMLLYCCLYVKYKLKVSWKLYYFDKEIFISSSLFSLAIFLQSVVNQVNSKVDITILGIMEGPESATRYSVAMQVYSVFTAISTAALAVYLPKFSRMVAEGKTDGKQITTAMIAPSRIQTLACGSILCGFFICGRDFVSVWMGDGFEISWLIALIIMVPMFFVYFNSIVVSVLDAMGKRLVRSLILVGVAICNIVLTIVLVYFFGEIGAPIGTAVATVLGTVIIMNIYYKKALGIKFLTLCKGVFKGIAPALLTASFVSLPFVFLVDVGFWGLLIKGGVFVISLVVFLMLFGFNKDEKSLLMGTLKKIKK